MIKSKSRIKQTAEIFTPTPLVNEILDKLNETDSTLFANSSKTFLDNSCGNGQFLIQVIERKIQGGSTFNQAVETTFGVDIMVDNVCDCIARIMLYTQTREDIFDQSGAPVEGLTEFGGYKEKDNADVQWLEKNHEWIRKYTYGKHIIYIRPCKDKWWMMQYSFDKKSWKLYHQIICADALKYHYRFDGTHPDDEKSKINKREELTNNLLAF
ncbi:MAG: hypothetical protein ACREAU_06490 [Nitrosopumilaceae archaeon]